MISLADFLTNAETFHRITHEKELTEAEYKMKVRELRERIKSIEDAFILCYKRCGPIEARISRTTELAISIFAVATVEEYLNKLTCQNKKQ